MKKLVFTTLLLSGLLLGGCSEQDVNKSTTETTSTTVKADKVDRETAKEVAKKQKEEESKKLVSLIPDTKIYFPGKKMVTIDDATGAYWGFDMKGATREEYEAFVQACRDDEWFTETVQGNDYFYAFTFDKEYYLMVSYNDFSDDKYVNVWVNKVMKNKTENADVNVNYNIEINE